MPSQFSSVDNYMPVALDTSGILADLALAGVFVFTYATLLLVLQGIVYLFNGTTKLGRYLLAIRTTRNIPVTAGILWCPACLSISWDDDLFVLKGDYKQTTTPLQPTGNWLSLENNANLYRACLMNITMLTDPFRYLLMRHGNIRMFKFIGPSGVVIYRKEASLKLTRSERNGLYGKGGFRLVEDISVSEKSWQEIIRYH